MRTKFQKGQQRKFLGLVVDRLNCISIRGILQFGFEISYDSLKSYYTERRLMHRNFFDDLGHLAKLDVKDFDVKYLEDNWGKVKGGKNGKRS